MEPFPYSAERYRAFLEGIFDRVAENPPLLDVPPRPPELELQSLWFSGAFGRSFQSTCGKLVRIAQFGHWNHGAGPDFTDTAVEIDGETLAGDIELDPEARDWERHGHATNPEFNHVVLHVFPKIQDGEAKFYSRTQDHRNIVQVELDLARLTQVSPRHATLPEAKLGRCFQPLQDMAPAQLDSLIEGAAQFRLQQKAERFAATADLHGWDEAMFQGLAEAMGYRPNKLPMRVLSQRFPVGEMLNLEPAEREARWFGTAGFLDGDPFEAADPDTRAYLRGLWNHWWKVRSSLVSLPDLGWKLSGIRPTNHPQRRIGAMVQLISAWPRFSQWVPGPGQKPAPSWPKRIREQLTNLEHTYWSHHYTLRSKPVAKPMALIGKDRISDILGNILFPIAIADHPGQWNDFTELPGSVENEKLRRAKLRLFGERQDREKLSKRFYQQQALIQIYEDFCLEDLSECEQCPFPEQLTQW